LARLEGGDRFDVILCDVMMAIMTGPQLYDALARVRPEACATLTFATGGMDPAVAKHVRATGRPCLQKPLQVAELRKLVDRA
jgi:CheY-like chemotaxis protein